MKMSNSKIDFFFVRSFSAAYVICIDRVGMIYILFLPENFMKFLSYLIDAPEEGQPFF